MSAPAPVRQRPRINLVPPETLTVEDQSDRLRLSARSVVIRCIEFLDLVWRREPTVFIELGVLWTVGVWSTTLLLFGLDGYPPAIATAISSAPEFAVGIFGAIIALSMTVSVVGRHRTARGYSSFAAAIWLGFLSFAILAGNHHLAGGYVYFGTAVAALLPFWRVVLDRRL